MKILIITDAWFPQVNGVVTTLSNVAYQLRLKGHTVDIIDPSRFKTLPLPGYREIRISLNLVELKKIIKFNRKLFTLEATPRPSFIAQTTND